MTRSAKLLAGQHGHYRLLTRLARGGMADIYLARPVFESEHKFVAAKLLLAGLADKERFREMFLDEAHLSSLLDHPNVVRGLDQAGPQAIILEYLAGESLAFLVRSALKRGRWFPAHLAAAVGAQVCAGLEYAHTLADEQGRPLHIIHRDVSPQNIVVLYSGGVKLLDFGIARSADRIHLTRTGVRKGKVCYMSPEQCLGRSLDVRSDLFSLGVVLWEILTGRRLFKRRNELESLRAIAAGQVPPLREYRPDLAPELEALVMRALSLDPAGRFASAGHMGTAIRNHLRRSQQPARKRDLATFYQEVLGDLLLTKRRLLKALEASDAELDASPLLAPNTEATLPSSPEIEEPSGSSEVNQSEERLLARVAPDQISDEWAESSDEPDDDSQSGEIREPAPPETAPDDDPVTAVGPGPLTPVTGDSPLATEPEAQTPSPARQQKAGQRAGPAARGLAVTGALGLVALAMILVWPESEPVPSAAPQPLVTRAPAEPEKPSAPPASPATAPGPQIEPTPAWLDVDSTPPGCLVLLDRAVLADETPVRRMPLPIGQEIVVRVECDGHAPDSQLALAGPGDHLKLAFRPSPLVTEPPTAGEQPATRPEPRRRTRTPRHGFLRLNTVPWTEVQRDGRQVGITPLLDLRLPAGRHRLVLVNQEAGIRKTITVLIKPGRTTVRYEEL